MATTVPGSLFTIVASGLFDTDGNPLANGFVYAYVASTTTPQNTFADVNLVTANPNPVPLNPQGRATMYLSQTSYTFVVTDANGVVQPIVLNPYEDIGQTLFNTLKPASPPTMVTVTSGYTVLTTDQVVLVNSSNGPNPCLIKLPPAASFIQAQVTIKNLGEIPLSVIPNGTDALDLIAGAYTVPASTLPKCPSIIVTSDVVANWYILGAIGLG